MVISSIGEGEKVAVFGAQVLGAAPVDVRGHRDGGLGPVGLLRIAKARGAGVGPAGPVHGPAVGDRRRPPQHQRRLGLVLGQGAKGPAGTAQSSKGGGKPQDKQQQQAGASRKAGK